MPRNKTMTRHPTSSRRAAMVRACLLCAVVLGGCQRMVNPWRDPKAPPRAVTTPSVEAVRAAEGHPSDLRRPYVEARFPTRDDGVSHGPLLYENPGVYTASEDNVNAWTGAEYWHLVYDPSRFLVSTVFSAISVVVTPPWRLMVSDGRISDERCFGPYDAARVPRTVANSDGT